MSEDSRNIDCRRAERPEAMAEDHIFLSVDEAVRKLAAKP
jgi:hypothetical protein